MFIKLTHPDGTTRLINLNNVTTIFKSTIDNSTIVCNLNNNSCKIKETMDEIISKISESQGVVIK